MSMQAEVEEEARSIRPLRAAAPESYNRLVSELESLHLHPYDVMAGAVDEDSGITVVLRYGSDLSREERQQFSREALGRMDDEVIVFFRQTGEKCSQALIADYYRMMKP